MTESSFFWGGELSLRILILTVDFRFGIADVCESRHLGNNPWFNHCNYLNAVIVCWL